MRQPRPKDRGLYLVEPRVDSRLRVMITAGLAAVPQSPDARRQRVVIRHHRAAVAKRAKILGRIETEGAGDADGADRAPATGGEMCLTAVFDKRQSVSRGNPRQRRGVGRLSVQMHWQDRPGA